MKSSRYLRGAGGIGVFLLLLATQIIRLPDLSTVALEGYDDLFQLALGLKAAHGAWPGLDFFTNYGPGVSALSALSWQWSNPILAEVLTGTGLLSIGLFAFWRAGFVAGHPVHNVSLLLVLLFLAPGWAKYYYVIWPGLFLLVLGDPGETRSARGESGLWLLLGGIVGVGGWFRPEIGLALSAGLAGALVLRWRAGAAGRSPVVLACFAATGALLPWIAYCMAAWIDRGRFGGPGDMIDFYLVSTVAKAVDFRWMAAYPRINGFFSPESLAGCFAIGVALTSLAVVICCFLRGAVQTPLGRRAWCAGWLLLCLFPQALHRFDLMHIVQVIAPGLVALSVGLAVWGAAADAGSPRLRLWLKFGAPASLAALVILSARIYWKTVPPVAGAIPRLQSLAAGLDALDPTSPDLRLAALARSHTRAGDTILVPSIDTRLIILVGRPFGGLFPHWSFRLPERWQERQIAALRETPAALVLHADYYRAADGPAFLKPLDFKGRNPSIDDYIGKTYPRTIYETPRWRILARSVTP